MKKCVHCTTEKPLEEFYKQKTSKDGHGSWCKVCQKAYLKEWGKSRAQRPPRSDDHVLRYRMKYRYKATAEEYNEQLEKQGGVCAICSAPPGERRLGWDHCHETGQGRGILCHRCNVGIGMFRDDPELLTAAIEYLQLSRRRSPGHRHAARSPVR